MCKTSWKDLAKRATSEALGLFVGQGRCYSRGDAAQLLGCNTRSLGNWQNQATAPELSEFLAQCRAFGPEYVNAVLRHVGMAGARWADQAEICERAVHSSVAQLGAKFAEAFEDGHIDHIERRQLAPLVREVHSRTGSFMHSGKVA